MITEEKKIVVKGKPASGKTARKVKDYGNDPFFVKNANESRKFLEKHGFPKDLPEKK